jgi:hypothetical protein
MAELVTQFPCLRRFAQQGFQHRPERDAPKFGMICLESANQRVYVEPNTGDFRMGKTITI